MSFGNLNAGTSEAGDFFPIERQRRLDLILHLLPNTREVILVRGPDQSGKSFFIKQLKTQVDQNWMFCTVQVDKLTQADTPLHVLAEAFDDMEGNTKQPLIRLEAWSKAGKKVIVCIEDAQKLDVARFDFIFQILGSYDCVHVVLTSSDNLGEAVESRCQLIDIEPFTQKQTAEYARNRVHKKSLDFVNVAGIDDVVLFIETGGLPGRINDVLEQMIHTGTEVQEAPKSARSIPMVWVVVAALIAAIILVFSLYPNEGSEQIAVSEIEEKLHLNERKAVKPVEAAVLTKEVQPETKELPAITEVELIVAKGPKEEVVLSKSEQKNKKEALKVEAKEILSTKKEAASFKAKNVVVESKAAVKKKVVQPVLKKEIKKRVVEAVKKELTVSQSNKQWIISRNNNNFTLQLLGVSTEESASKFIAEHKEIKALYFFQNKRNDGKWFSVIYGDFKNKEAAMKKAKKMPSSLSKIKPWVRQFDAVKKDLFVKN